MPIDPKAKSTWLRAENAYQHYRQYMATKSNQFTLSFTDLIYVKNFKGGSSVIGESTTTLKEKLMHYEHAIRSFDAQPESKLTLAQLDDGPYESLRGKMVAFANLPNERNADINGFGVSFASTLLHFHFPHLVPILDRRALNGSLIPGLVVNGDNQVINLLDLYPALINYFRARLREDLSLTLRELDSRLFEVALRVPPFRRKRSSDG